MDETTTGERMNDGPYARSVTPKQQVPIIHIMVAVALLFNKFVPMRSNEVEKKNTR